MPERTVAERLERYLFGYRPPRERPFNALASVGGAAPRAPARPKPVRPKHPTTLRLIQLVEDGKVINQACAAQLLGVSHQRVQQIVKAEGLMLGSQHQKNTLIEWPCPECGIAVQMWTVSRNLRQSAYCRACSTRARERPVPVAALCSVAQCKRDARTRGLCMGHFNRWQNDGAAFDTGAVQEYGHRGTGCTEEECPNGYYAKGLCRSHYARLRTLRNWKQAVRRA